MLVLLLVPLLPLASAVGQSLSIADSSATEGDRGTTTDMEFTVTLEPASLEEVSVDYKTVAVWANPRYDYYDTVGRLRFSPGETTKTVTVTVVGDDEDETQYERFWVVLEDPVGARISDSVGVGRIIDDDGYILDDENRPTVTLHLDRNSVGEDGGVVTVTASQSHRTNYPTAFTVTVTPVSPASADDYRLSRNRALRIPSRALTSRGEVTITALDNDVFARDKQVSIGASHPPLKVHPTNPATLTITDDGDSPPVLSIGDATLDEGASGGVSMEFPLTLSYTPGAPVTVDWATSDGTAEARTDYVSGSDSLTFEIGERAGTVSVQVTDDTVDERDETFTVALSNVAGATLGKATGTGTIRDDEIPVVTIVAESETVIEEQGDVAFIVRRTSEDRSEPLTVDVLVKAPGHHEAGPGTVGFRADETTKRLGGFAWRDIAADDTYEITLVEGEGYRLGTSSEATVTIRDDDAPPTVSIADADAVTEGAALVFPVTLSGPYNAGIAVDYSLGGTATAGDDYTGSASGTVTFPAGSMRAEISLATLDDDVDEADGTVEVTLSLPGSSRAVLGRSLATGTIADNDLPLVTVASGGAVTEGSPAVFTLTRAGETAAGLDVAYEVTASGDFGAVTGSGTAMFLADNATVQVDVATTGDDAHEARGSVTLTLTADSGADPAWLPGDPATAEVTVRDDDDSPATGAVAITGTAAEGATLTATTSGIADEDGLTGATYAWQWLRTLPGGSAAAIAGATDATYVPVAADAGATLKVRVTVTDDEGHEATFESAPTSVVVALLALSGPEDQIVSANAPITLTLPAATGGTGPYAYSLAPLPAGLSFDADSRVLSGTPTVNGNVQLTYTARDSAALGAAEVAATFALNVVWRESLTLHTPAKVVAYRVGESVELVLPEATGGTGPYAYSLAPLPAGLSFDADSRVLSGTPTELGLTRLTYGAWDADAPPATATRGFRIRINKPLALALASPAKVVTYGVGESVELVLPEATGGTGPYAYSLAPLPAGLSFDADSRVLSGTPTELGLTRLTYGVTDAGDPPASVTRGFRLRIDKPAPLSLAAPGKLIHGVGESVEVVLPEAAGGTGPYAYSLAPLPAGLSFDADSRVLSGTPTELGLTRLTYGVTDAGDPPASVTRGFRLRITRGGPDEGALPVVTVSAAAGTVTEGVEAVFVLERTGDASAPLTVTVAVSQAGSVLAGPVPTSVTFGEDEARARLRVATADDLTAEADGRVTATLSAGSGYRVSGGTAVVDVLDNDAPAAPVGPVTLWSTTMTVADFGASVGASGPGLPDAAWSEGGVDYELDKLRWFGSPHERVKARFSRRPSSADELTLHAGELSLVLSEGGAGRVLHWPVAGVPWSVGAEVELRLTRTVADDAPAAAPGVSVADAQVNESAGMPLAFRVELSEAQGSAVSVRYATSDGSATAGADYVAASGMVRFEAGETVKTVNVAVLEDSHDEGEETLTLTLSGAFGATVEDGTATGTIVNSDAIPQAWLARFGRTVAGQVMDAVEARMTAAREPGADVAVAGRRAGAAGSFDVSAAREGEGLAEWLRGETGLDEGTVSGREVLSGTSFALTEGTAGSGFVSLWGGGAVTDFDGRDGVLSVDGEVRTGLLGADWTRAGWAAGLMVGHSRGEGSYSGQGAGTVSSSLTGFYPWGRQALGDRVTVWGVAGYGEGTLTLEPEGGARIETDMDLGMAAVGLHGVLMEAPAEGGLELAAKTDGSIVRTASAAAQGRDGGMLEAASGEVTRLRLGLEGTQAFRSKGGGTLTPSLELGVRHDGGDAETGFGVDMGASLSWADPSSGVKVDLRGRGLLGHEASGFREAGFSGSVVFDPSPSSDRGLNLSLNQTLGRSASGGMDALYEADAMAGLGADDDAEAVDLLERRRLEVRVGYGLSAFGGGFTGMPEFGFGQSESGRDYSLGWRLRPEGRDAGAFEVRLEATRREAANDDAPEHGVGLRATMRW